MALPELPYYPEPEEPLELEWTPNVELVQYGDGYVGRYKRGINANVRKYTMNYTSLTQHERDTIVTFIVNREGIYAFTYVIPGEANARKFIVPEGITQTARAGRIYDVSFVMQEVFDQ